MNVFQFIEMARAVDGLWQGEMPACITGVSHDTRTVKPGNLYVALRGDQFDGHAFVADAFSKGAAAVMVDGADEQPIAGPVLRVSDTLVGLQELARGYRKTWSSVSLGITGSVGKTTVKEMCADVLSMRAPTHRTAGNYNNHIGLPLTMLAQPDSAEFGVFELGMSHPGEIAALAQLLAPTHGIVTDICNAHRENFPSLEAIATEKMALLEQLPAGGLAILDGDSAWFERFRAHTDASIQTFSFSGKADFCAQAMGARVLRVNDFEYEMPLPGEHIMRNAVRAIALGLSLGIQPAEIATGLQKFQAPPMRWQKSTYSGVTFINDAYNANPLSMRAGLKTFSELPVSGKRWVVLGGMRELGPSTHEEHLKLGEFVERLGFDGVITVGALGESILATGPTPFFHCREAGEAAEILHAHLGSGDQVLLKASRGEHLETVLTQFKEL